MDTLPSITIDPHDLIADLLSVDAGDGGYAAACGLSTLLSDLHLLAGASCQSASILRHACVSAVRAGRLAQAIASNAYSPSSTNSASILAARAALIKIMRPITLVGDLGAMQSIVDSALTLPMPECFGYDIGDSELCVLDAHDFEVYCNRGRPVIVLGIRGGGAVLAPRWAVALKNVRGAPVPWMTVRPIGAASGREGYHPFEITAIARLCKGMTERPNVVIIDDQPHSGETVAKLAACIRPMVGEIWFSCIGRVGRVESSGCIAPLRSRSQLLPRRYRPLWQCLLPEDRDSFLERLSNTLPSSIDAFDVEIRCPTLELLYGRERPWLPWNHPDLADQPRRLINPKKTPLLVCGQNGAPLLHLRFVGEGAYGRAEFERVQRTRVASAPAWFIDGYRVSAHVPVTKSVRSALTSASHDRTAIVQRCGEMLKAALGSTAAIVSGVPSQRSIGAKLTKRLMDVRKYCGVSVAPPIQLSWLLADHTPAYGAQLKPLRTSLRYAHGHWHWQVTPSGEIHRFHLEATWGGISWPELEIAVFALEQRLSPEDLLELVAACGLGLEQLPDVARSLPAATCLIVDTLARELRKLSPSGVERLRDDFEQLWITTLRFAELLPQHRLERQT